MGLQTLTILLQDGVDIRVPIGEANFLYVKDSSITAKYRLSRENIGDRSGQTEQVELGQDEYIETNEPFDVVTINQNSGANVTVVLNIGSGRYNRVASGRVGSADFTATPAQTSLDQGDSVEVCAADPLRKRAIVQSDLNNAATLYAGDADQGATTEANCEGLQLLTAQAIVHESKDSLWLTNPSDSGSDAQIVRVLEETYN